MRLLFRVADTTLPAFFVVYLGGVWLFWGDGVTSAQGSELTSLARWLCLGWLPSSMLSLGFLYARASHGKLSALPARARHRIALGFLFTVPLWLALTEWAVHRLHRGVVACDGTLSCMASGPDPVPELTVQGESSATAAQIEATADPQTDRSIPRDRQSHLGDSTPPSGHLPDPREAALPLRPESSVALRRDAGAAPSSQEFASFPAAPSGPASPASLEEGESGAPASAAREGGYRAHPNAKPSSAGRFDVARNGDKLHDAARTEWWPTGGKRCEGRSVDGVREGPWREWQEDGTLVLSATYENGEPQGDLQRWHPNGQIALHRDELRTEDGRVLWVEEAFHRSGLRARRAQYQDGVLHGPTRAWSEEGALLEAGAYRAGQRHGSWIRYEANGAIASAQEWKRGSRVQP